METNESAIKKWCPVGRVERRVLGVLVEKSKTTPDVYPMTINAITTAANQKSNRKPLMQLDHDDVDDALIELREKGAVVEIQGDGRKAKYRHRLYEWMDVDKVELAVMAELLLRGEQTIGDLRGRASRMEKIADVAELKPIVQTLSERNLIIALTPEGRGQMVTHNLYQPQELDKVKANVDVSAIPDSPRPQEAAVAPVSKDASSELQQLTEMVELLQSELESLQSRVEKLESN